MIATLASDCTLAQKAAILRFIEGYGLRVHVGEAGSTTVVSIIGDPEPGMAEEIAGLVGVESVSTEAPRYPFVAREARNSPTTVRVGDVLIGGTELVVIAGPCSVESGDQIARIARGVAASGAVLLRGGAFKPRTSPYAFQGLGEEGLQLLAGGPGGDRARRGLGVCCPRGRRSHDQLCRHAPGGKPQHAELPPPVGGRGATEAGAAETRADVHDRRAPVGRRVHRGLREPAGGSL